MGRVAAHYIRLPMAPSNLALSNCGDGASTASGQPVPVPHHTLSKENTRKAHPKAPFRRVSVVKVGQD